MNTYIYDISRTYLILLYRAFLTLSLSPPLPETGKEAILSYLILSYLNFTIFPPFLTPLPLPPSLPATPRTPNPQKTTHTHT